MSRALRGISELSVGKGQRERDTTSTDSPYYRQAIVLDSEASVGHVLLELKCC